MKKILMLLTLVLSLQCFAGATDSDAQEEKATDYLIVILGDNGDNHFL